MGGKITNNGTIDFDNDGSKSSVTFSDLENNSLVNIDYRAIKANSIVNTGTINHIISSSSSTRVKVNEITNSGTMILGSNDQASTIELIFGDVVNETGATLTLAEGIGGAELDRTYRFRGDIINRGTMNINRTDAAAVGGGGGTTNIALA